VGFYSGQSGRVRTVCISSLCVVSVLFSRFNISALVWFSNLMKYLKPEMLNIRRRTEGFFFLNFFCDVDIQTLCPKEINKNNWK
jgi:hypothetical protein